MLPKRNRERINFFTRFPRVLILACFLVSCSVSPATNPPAATSTEQNTPEQASPFTTSPSPKITSAPTDALPSLTPTPAEIINPLTGLPVNDPSLLYRRPVMVKVANFPRSGRPHAGLSFADLVFEYYIGEATNRFLAVYYGNDAPQVGPIRSGRLVDAQLVSLYQGVLGYEGADPIVQQTLIKVLEARAINGSAQTCPAICDDGKHTVVSVFANTHQVTLLNQQHGEDSTSPRLDGMEFGPLAVPDKLQEGTDVFIRYNPLDIGEFRYDTATGKYLRWIENVDPQGTVTMVPLTDRLTQKQLAFSNVILVFAFYKEYNPTLQDVQMWDNQDGLRAVVFRDGKAIEGIWKTNAKDQPIRFFTSQDKPLILKPGNSWMIITGWNSSLQTSKGLWNLTFALP